MTFPAGSEVKKNAMVPVVISTTKQDTTVTIRFQGKQKSGSLKLMLGRKKEQAKAVESKGLKIPMTTPQVKYVEGDN